MAAGLLSAYRQNFSGLRPLNMRRDLGDVADLIEHAFADTLDASGRAGIAEMRALSRAGPLLWLIARLNYRFPAMRGFVWIEAGRVVGNVTLAPTGYGGGWIVANVAVASGFRRRGIARRLMEAALEQVAAQGRFGILQVDADNDAARGLYESLGFRAQRTFVRWRRPAYLGRPAGAPAMPPLRRTTRYDADAVYALAERVRPESSGGLGWLRSTTRQALRPPFLGTANWLLSGRQVESWVVTSRAQHADALLRAERRLGGLTTMFDLLVDRPHQGTMERPLLSFLLRLADERRQPFVTDHPADDEAASAALRDMGFWQERVQVHMLWQAPHEDERAARSRPYTTKRKEHE